MICIYHNKDLDGYCSGAIVKKKFPDAKMIGYDYGQPFPWEELIPGEPVVMIDVSLPMDEMYRIGKYTNNQFTWIDHHVSAIKDFNADHNVQNVVRPVLAVGVAACELGWNHFFPEFETPPAVTLLGAYDTWRKDDARWDNWIMPFQYGMRLRCNSVENFPINLLDEQRTFAEGSIIKVHQQHGFTILAYQKMQNEAACRGSFVCEFMGLQALCLNIGGANSQVFDSVYDWVNHDIMITFFYNGRHWKFTLFTTNPDIDCSLLAKQFGGGGHMAAAGFELDHLPDTFKKD